VIPTLLVVGLVFGRWWRIVVPIAVLGWPALLIATDVAHGLSFALVAGALAAANVLIGVLANFAIRLVVRWVFASVRHGTLRN
jgi:hypothetical protein